MDYGSQIRLSDSAYSELSLIAWHSRTRDEVADLTCSFKDALEGEPKCGKELVDLGLAYVGDLEQIFFTDQGKSTIRELFPSSTDKFPDCPGFRVQIGHSHSLSTGGMGPCTGIAIVDSEFRAAVIGHFYFPPLETEEFDEMLVVAKATIPDFHKAVVQLAGTTRELDEPESYGPGAMLLARNFVKSKLIKIGIDPKNIREDWNDKNTGQNIIVNLALKTITVKTF